MRKPGEIPVSCRKWFYTGSIPGFGYTYIFTDSHKGSKRMKKRYISRTIKFINCEVLCIDKHTRETFTQFETATGNFKTEDALLKYLHEKIDTDVVSVVTVLEKEEKTGLFSMSEEDFIKYADEVKKRYRTEE